MAEKRLMNMVQGDHQSNDAYRLRFENQANVVESMGGQLYRGPTLDIISQKKYNTDYANLTNDADKATTIEMATEMWKATLFITNSNQNRFDQLKKELHNNYIRGDENSYPSTLNEAYTRLNQHRSFSSVVSGGSATETSFAQKKSNYDSDRSSNKLALPPNYRTPHDDTQTGIVTHAEKRDTHLARDTAK
jgi:uncharacterized membrane-anchored protein YhcB (DUF1043 family)